MKMAEGNIYFERPFFMYVLCNIKGFFVLFAFETCTNIGICMASTLSVRLKD